MNSSLQSYYFRLLVSTEINSVEHSEWRGQKSEADGAPCTVFRVTLVPSPDVAWFGVTAAAREVTFKLHSSYSTTCLACWLCLWHAASPCSLPYEKWLAEHKGNSGGCDMFINRLSLQEIHDESCPSNLRIKHVVAVTQHYSAHNPLKATHWWT